MNRTVVYIRDQEFLIVAQGNSSRESILMQAKLKDASPVCSTFADMLSFLEALGYRRIAEGRGDVPGLT